MYYDKRIRYLSYYESGIKLQNAGYVKFQVRDSLCQMVIYMKGPRLMGSGEAKVYLLSEKEGRKEEEPSYLGNRENNLQKHLLGNFGIRNGQGHCAVRMDAENMGDSGMRYDEICGIKIELHEYQYLESQWVVTNFMPKRQKRQNNEEAGYGMRKPQSGSSNEDIENCSGSRGELQENFAEIDLIVTPVSENVKVEKLIKEEPAEEFVIEKISKDDFLQEKMEPKTIEEVDCPKEAVQEILKQEDSMQEILEREIRKEEAKKEWPKQTLEEEILKGMENIDVPEQIEEMQPSERELEPDKWEQLKKTYPIVHPIREEEEYLKIEPKDFVIFHGKYQELVHNSFLLHGYYNYKHLILGKKEKEGKIIYYLGVPGTFHEREKTVAIMFGFEAFDGKREPAQKGDFGYYLRRVEI